MAPDHTLVLVAGKQLGGILQKEIRQAFPTAEIREVSSIKSDEDLPEARERIAVLIHPTAAEIDFAAAALDECRLPRWAILVVGPVHGRTEIALPSEECSPEVVGEALKSALLHHALKRENARARGDLKTVGRRLTHDLRAQVGGIVTTAEAVSEGWTEKTGSTRLQPIIDATEGMLKLIERISAVTRASSTVQQPEILDMGLACWGAIQRLEMQILRQRATLAQPAAWPEVRGVAAWLEIIWWNLLANALEHAGKEAYFELGWDADARTYRFWIEDTGQGVPVEKQAQLFHPFHLLHEPNAPNGLGLSIVRRFVELQGGRCGYERVDSTSRFYFTLPK
ncbi:MAG: two-component system, NtrC family, sensor histidine kinase KinB [Verrucomicrobiota bacterium]|jgi:signal transduction histidine kinase